MSEQIIRKGAKLYTRAGEEVVVHDVIDRGGQGEVYTCTFRGQRMAFKLWFDTGTTEQQREEVAANCLKGPPCETFVWPKELVVGKGEKPIGYVMELVSKNFWTLDDRLLGKCKVSYFALVTMCMELTQAMIALHGRSGRAYCDLSANNILFNSRGNTRLIDCDNCVRDGVDVGILFSFGAAAPELVRGEAKPTIKTDLYALAAIIYMALVGGVPLEGRRVATATAPDFARLKRIHGDDPVFVFHPADRRNAPHRVAQQSVAASWKLLPNWTRQMFVEAFTSGLIDPSARFREAKWRDSMIALRDSIAICTSCGAHCFTEAEKTHACWSCKKGVKIRREMTIGKHRVVLNRGSCIYPHHVRKDGVGDVTTAVGRVIAHPEDRRIWGLKNVSESAWSVTMGGDQSRQIGPSEVAPVARGTQISFGGVVAQIS